LIRNRIEDDGETAYDLIIYVANWPEKRAEHWKTLLKARAIENQCYVIGVNRVGTDENQLHYSGDSIVNNPLGEVLIDSIPRSEIVFKALLSKKHLYEIRKMLPFLKDR
jgi:predicted amidohydrolase